MKKSIIKEEIDKIPDLGAITNIIFGDFNEFGGLFNIDTEKFNYIRDNFGNEFKTKMYRYKRRVYDYRGLRMYVTKNDKRCVSIEKKYVSLNKYLCIFIDNEKLIDDNSFPIINKYHNICNQQTTCYEYYCFDFDKDNKIKILFIEENTNNTNNKVINYIKIEYENKINFKDIKNILVYIINNL
jgi:hypothetical protein